MTRQDILDLFERRLAAVNRRDVRALTDLYAEDGVVESLMAGTVKGRAAIGDVYRAWFAAFPDVVVTADDLLIDGLRAAHAVTQTGTDIGPFMGLPPTGKPFRLPIVYLYEFRDGHILHERRIYDFTGLLVQIGVLKAKPA
jgi:steroid delta-isomerase-like uncharacterized protein